MILRGAKSGSPNDLLLGGFLLLVVKNMIHSNKIKNIISEGDHQNVVYVRSIRDQQARNEKQFTGERAAM